MTPTKKPATSKGAAKKVPVRSSSAKKRVKRIKPKTVSARKRVRRKAPESTVMTAPSLAFYRRIAIGFVCLVLAALLAVVYVSTVEATITITSVHEDLTSEFVVDVVETPVKNSEIAGRVLVGTLGKTGSFTPTGEGATQVDGTATGVVTLYNELSSSQPLIATTRLLTSEGILFRMKEGATVPANGSVEVEVYADQEGVSGDIGPSSFTIPGLNATKQASVYAKSTESMSGGVATISVVSEEEMQQAANQLHESLKEDAISMLEAEAGEDLLGESFVTEVISEEYSIEPNTEADGYDVTVTIKVIGVFYDLDALKQIAVGQLYEQIGEGREFIAINTDEMLVEVSRYQTEPEGANVHVVIEGKVITSRTSDALEVDRFTGMLPSDIYALLVGEGVATDVTVELSPFFVRRIPRMADHIYLEIE
jgi:hypothetical protein